MSAIIALVGWDSAFVYSVLCSFVFDFSTYEKFFEHFGGNALSRGVWVCVKVGHGGFILFPFGVFGLEGGLVAVQGLGVPRVVGVVGW